MFKERLKGLRIKRGLTAQQISDRLGIARSTYSGYERGHRMPSPEYLAGLSEILKTSTDYLLGLSEDDAPKDPDRNINNYLRETGLHFNGVPLTEDDLKPLREFLRIMVAKQDQKN